MDTAVIRKGKRSADEDPPADKQPSTKKSRGSKKAQLAPGDDTNRANEDQDTLDHRSETLEPDPSELLRRVEDNEQQFFCFAEDTTTQLAQLGDQLKQVLLMLESLKQPRARQTHTEDADSDNESIERGIAPTSLQPIHIVKKAYPWVKEPVLLDILGLKLETKDLPKLIPPRYRPKGRIATNGITGTSVLIDTANSTTTIIEPDNPAHDKEITDIRVILAILNVYAGIRAAYDTAQGTQMGIAINAHATQLAHWDRYDRYSFKGILLYFTEHFEAHQESLDPMDWIRIDQQLFTLHMRQQPLAPEYAPISSGPSASPSKRHDANRGTSPTKSQGKEICRNFNNQSKGCQFQTCNRRHICIICAQDSQTQPAFLCKHAGARTASGN